MKNYKVTFTNGCDEIIKASSTELAKKKVAYYKTIGFFPQIKSIKLCPTQTK